MDTGVPDILDLIVYPNMTKISVCNARVLAFFSIAPVILKHCLPYNMES